MTDEPEEDRKRKKFSDELCRKLIAESMFISRTVKMETAADYYALAVSYIAEGERILKAIGGWEYVAECYYRFADLAVDAMNCVDKQQKR